jgi:Inhibitor of Apoptosis domain
VEISSFCYFNRHHSENFRTEKLSSLLSKHKCTGDTSDIPEAENIHLKYASHRMFTFLSSSNWNLIINLFSMHQHLGFTTLGVNKNLHLLFFTGSKSVFFLNVRPQMYLTEELIHYVQTCLVGGGVDLYEDVAPKSPVVSAQNTNTTPFPQHLEMISKNARFDSFSPDWYGDKVQEPAFLSEAGLFSTDVLDETVCFHCSGIISGWKEHHDPWIEHARWFPHCHFLQSVMDTHFID